MNSWLRANQVFVPFHWGVMNIIFPTPISTKPPIIHPQPTHPSIEPIKVSMMPMKAKLISEGSET